MARGQSRRKEEDREPQRWSQSQRGDLRVAWWGQCLVLNHSSGKDGPWWRSTTWNRRFSSFHAARPPGRVNSRPCALGREILVEESNVQGWTGQSQYVTTSTDKSMTLRSCSEWVAMFLRATTCSWETLWIVVSKVLKHTSCCYHPDPRQPGELPDHPGLLLLWWVSAKYTGWLHGATAWALWQPQPVAIIDDKIF